MFRTPLRAMKQKLTPIKHLAALACAAILPFISAYAQAPNPGAASLSPAAAEVAKLVAAGTTEDVVLAYVQNAPGPFNLSADNVLYLKDLGVASAVITAMLNHDSALRSQAPPPAPAVEAPPPAAAPAQMAPVPAQEMAPPPPAAPAPVYVNNPPPDVGYFYNDLAPYGTWADLPGYGWCWQPTVIATTPGWQPYCHGGNWLNTDAGWFWASSYSWGWAPFHYGRWYRHPGAGWVWFPGRTWGPSWVVWRSGGGNCGWAPLPPRADFVAGVGWRYNGVNVAASFDFGLSVGCFTFVSMGQLCEPNLHTRCLPPAQVTRVYNNTTVINNYTYVNNTYVNRGVNITTVEQASGRRYQRIKVADADPGVPPAGSPGNVALRRKLGDPPPATHMKAVRADSQGRIPLGAGSAARINTSNLSPMGGKSGTGNQTGGVGSAGKGGGTTRNFSGNPALRTPPPGTGVPPKTTTATGAQQQILNGTPESHKLTGPQGTPLGSSNPNAPKVYNQSPTVNRRTPGSASRFQSTSPATGTGISGTGGGTGGSASSSSFGSGSTANKNKLQQENLQQARVEGPASAAKGPNQNPTPYRYMRAEDMRGATGLTTRDNKLYNSSSGNSSQNSAGPSGGSAGASRYGSNPNLQRNTSGSSGSTKGTAGNASPAGGNTR
jgi:hypothetical protein